MTTKDKEIVCVDVNNEELDINTINKNNNIPSFTYEDYKKEKVVRTNYHICFDGTVLNYHITDLDLQRKEITVSNKVMEPANYHLYQDDITRILDKEYGVWRHI